MGFSSITGDETIMFADNASFDGTQRGGKLTADGQLWIGSSTSPHVVKGSLGSSDGSITWTVGHGTITGQVAGGTTVGKTITGNTGGPISPVAGNWNVIASGSLAIDGSGNTLTTRLTGLTNHAVLIGAGNDTITKIAATANTGAILQNNSGADPSYSTATYPSTTTINQLLYSSAANTVAGLSTANSAALVTSSAGVPSLAAMTSGQLIIGNTGGTPTAAVPTSTGGNFVTGAGSLKYIPANFSPGSSNIGIAYSVGTFTVQGYDGTALSATNPGYVTLQSKANPGRYVTIAVTANQTFTDGSSGQIDNARFGVTTGVNWLQDMPFFIYGVMDDSEAAIAFMISRNPCATLSPASTSISKQGTIINVDQGDFYAIPNITVTSYDQNPCICLGSFRMQFAGATDSYTVQTLSTNDGIGNFNDNTVFTFPSGQNGAASGTYILSNAGTEPVWTTNGMVYSIQKNGLVKYNFNGQTPSTTGVGTQTLQPVLPYAIASTNQEDCIPCRYTSSSTVTVCLVSITSSTSAVATIVPTASATAVKNQDITIASVNNLQFTTIYRAYTATGV